MTLALSGDSIANETDNHEERDPKQQQHSNRREGHPLRPELQWEINTHNTDHEQGTYQRSPPSLEEHVLRFFPHHCQDVAHVFSSSISVRKTSSRLALPFRTSSTSPPDLTIKLTRGLTLLSPRSS